MKSLRFLDRRVGFSLGAVSLLLGMVAPAVVPAFASADQITGRSIQMSTAEEGATASYELTFTPVHAATYVVLFMCDNTPLTGESCSTPTGGSFAAATGTTGATLDSTNHKAQAIVLSSAITAATQKTIDIGGVVNPSTTNHTFYVRIETFAGGSAETQAAAAYADPTVETGLVDDGAVALSTSDTIGVSAAVLESLTFCVYGDPGNTDGNNTADNSSNDSGYLGGLTTNANGPGANCNDNITGHTNSNAPASVKLGQYVSGSVYALDTAHVSYAADWSQISTNANGGAIVYLKSSNSCSGGGLSRGDGTTCDIPGSASSLTAGTAGFGVSLGTPSNLDTVTTDDGTLNLDSTYDGHYALGSTSNSTYGDAFYDTNSGPAANWDVPMGIGAAIANNTPAGNYKDNLSLIAAGTF